MCGEIDEQVVVGQDLRARLNSLTSGMDLPKPSDSGENPVDLADAAGRGAYMERIFRAGLARSLEDIERATDDESVDALAAQAIALARLAGFLAGQLPPEADLFRALIEAVSSGHAEPQERAQTIRRAHDHHHGHANDHHH
ncbi:MAG: hypothetical protein HOI22_13180 [Tateyamaria sp.]|jgi:hypothetical protein|nr:hypothetical protein [Tateyamaria sp.]